MKWINQKWFPNIRGEGWYDLLYVKFLRLNSDKLQFHKFTVTQRSTVIKNQTRQIFIVLWYSSTLIQIQALVQLIWLSTNFISNLQTIQILQIVKKKKVIVLYFEMIYETEVYFASWHLTDTSLTNFYLNSQLVIRQTDMHFLIWCNGK